jgi:hypothetical protein
MATPEQPSESTPTIANRTKRLFQASRERVARLPKVINLVVQILLPPLKRLMRFLLQTGRPRPERLLPPIGILSILLLTWWTVGVPTGGAFKHLWPIAAFTVCGIIFAWILYRTSRERQNAVFENTFGWLPVFLGALSFWYWHWYANQQPFDPQKEFFLASAEVLPLLLLAAVVDVRRTERLQSKQLVLPVVAVFLGELAALNALAFGTSASGSYNFAAVASSFVSSIVALVLAVMANIAPSGRSEPETVEGPSPAAPEVLGAEEPKQTTSDRPARVRVKARSREPAD